MNVLPEGRRLRIISVVLYAALIGILLAFYISPLKQIVEDRSQIASLKQSIQKTEQKNVQRRLMVHDLNTRAGIERAARARYGMIMPGEKVYVIPKKKGR